MQNGLSAYNASGKCSKKPDPSQYMYLLRAAPAELLFIAGE